MFHGLDLYLKGNEVVEVWIHRIKEKKNGRKKGVCGSSSVWAVGDCTRVYIKYRCTSVTIVRYTVTYSCLCKHDPYSFCLRNFVFSHLPHHRWSDSDSHNNRKYTKSPTLRRRPETPSNKSVMDKIMMYLPSVRQISKVLSVILFVWRSGLGAFFFFFFFFQVPTDVGRR